MYHLRTPPPSEEEFRFRQKTLQMLYNCRDASLRDEAKCMIILRGDRFYDAFNYAVFTANEEQIKKSALTVYRRMKAPAAYFLTQNPEIQKQANSGFTGRVVMTSEGMERHKIVNFLNMCYFTLCSDLADTDDHMQYMYAEEHYRALVKVVDMNQLSDLRRFEFCRALEIKIVEEIARRLKICS